MAILILPSQSLVLNAYAVLIGQTPGNASLKEHQAFIAANGVNGYKAALEGYASSAFTTAELATALLTNLGLGNSFSQAQAVAFLNANPGNRVGAMTDLASQLYGYSGTDAKLLASKAAYVTAIEGSFNFSNNIANVDGKALTPVVVDGQTYALTAGLDNLVGSAFADTFTARTLNNVNTLNDGDKIDGGAGNDTVYVDFATTGLAITPVLKNIETVVVRAQGIPSDATNGNNTSSGNFAGLVQIDAQRSLAVNAADQVTADLGVTRWESNNSRSDVVIEDVRIGNAQKTSDVTIAMVETDPGNVDFAVYFDQQSLRNKSSGSSTLELQIIDAGAANTSPSTPLLNNPYDQLRIGVNGALFTIQLDKVAVAAADTYEALLAVFKTALASTGATVELGSTFTVPDQISGKPVVGRAITITAASGVKFDDTVKGSGFFNTTDASVPVTSSIFTTFRTGASNLTELVTSKVLLDDVGRSNMGGDLVIGGMSTGDTSSYAIYRGVERFEITVGDNSKLQTINSTNNALREVTIVSGATSRTAATADAYTTTVTNEGDLTVNGDANNIPAGGINNFVATSGGNNNLPGVENNSPLGIHHGTGAAGFTDVRLIDASNFKGKLAFTAAITGDSIDKYITSVDTAANPLADVASSTANVNFNVKGANFNYTGGNDNDTMVVTIDTAAVSSRSTVVSGLSDFTFKIEGGEGNDAITTTIIGSGLAGGAQAWYTNQKLNANITINGGDGDDTIRTPGAGDKIIDAGTGNDTVYTDNTGALNATAVATGTAGSGALAYTNAAALELAAGLTAASTANVTDATATAASTAGFGAGAAAVVAALNTLDQLTANATAADLTAAGVVPAAPNAGQILTATKAAFDAGAITAAQKVAIDIAYNAVSAEVEVKAVALGAPSTFTTTAPTGVVNIGAGDAAVAPILTAANTALAAALGADAKAATQLLLLDASQNLVVTRTLAMTAVDDRSTGANEAGTTTILNGLIAVQSALVLNASDVAVVAALNAGIASGAISSGLAASLVGGAGPMTAGEVAAAALILSPLLNTATNNNVNAQTALTLAIKNDTDLQVVPNAGLAASNNSGAAPDSVSSGQTFAASQAAAAAALTAANNLATANAKEAGLIALRGAITTATQEVAALNLLNNAENAGFISPAENTALAGFVGAAATATLVSASQKLAFDTGATGFTVAGSVDDLITKAHANVEALTVVSTTAAGVAAATATANTVMQAAVLSGGNSLSIPSPKAVFVFDTSNQTSTYNVATQDDRNLADLKSSPNDPNNFFNSTVKVTYKGLDASVVVAGTGYKTTDLEINQAIKLAINSDAVLSKLLVATDGPANTLVVTSLIDGLHTTGMLAVTLTMATSVTSADLAGAIAAGLVAAGSTDAALITAMGVAKTAFDARGDYVTQFAESGAAGGNTPLVGADSKSSSDNKVTPGTGSDVIVLGTTVGTDAPTSSNEVVIVIASASTDKDTIVNFAATGLGIDQFDFSALNGRAANFGSVSADKSILVGAPTALGATVLTDVQVAALFTDSALAINHVYVAVDSNNIGSIWQVADAAGTGAGSVTAKLVGSIDLADTIWGNLTAANFV